ncbi:helicase ARIP4-like, partial [Python bivittatus]|uniref:Helicase ARIP4-like n=1 Tax=Python bivittatus TaxID=176946 RepID=A0A9F2R863_PYTBI
SQGPSLESTSNGRHNASSPKLPNTEELTRPISPDSPEIISELQQYAEAAAARESKHNSPTTNTTPGHPTRKDNAAHSTARGTEQRVGTHGLASSTALPATSQNVDSHSVLDLRGNKRKSTSPSGPDEQAHRQQKKRSLPTTGQPYESGYPVSGGFTMPSVPLNHNLTHPFAPQAGNPLYMGTGSSYYQLPSLLSDPHLVFPVTTDPLLTAGTASSSAATSATASVPSFMLNPSMTGMLSNYSLPFSQSLLPEPRMFAPFPAPVLSSSLPRSMASAYPGFMSPHAGYPAGGLLRSQVPPFDTREVSEVGCSSNEDEDKDDDVIEITGK